MDVRTCLEKERLLFDGAMGTYYASLYPNESARVESANLEHPERIRAIHTAYLEAGARAVKTNTFAPFGIEGTDFEEVLRAGWTLAVEAAAPYDAAVFADLGPSMAPAEDYERAIDLLLSLGAENFLLETFAEASLPERLAQYIRARCPHAFIMVSFAVDPDGMTAYGQSIRALLRQAGDCAAVDAVGMNCVSGPSHLLRLMGSLEAPALLSVMPNAGYPTVVRGRTVYEGTPDYFAGRMAEIAAAGARILGGCCGTTPAFIEAVAETLRHGLPTVHPLVTVRPRKEGRNRLAEKLDAGRRVIAVELDPPEDADIAGFMDGARRLTAAGADTITIADCPIARPRVDSSMLAAKLRRELGIDPLPHMTCRDRNVNATRALLLGLSIEEVRNVLVVTGDPVPSAERENIKSVFSFHSSVLADYIRTLGEQGAVVPFRVFGALNVNARNFDAELKKAVRKREAGVAGFLTQPVMTERAFENLARAHELMPEAAILGGVIPVVSERNALFMNNEVSGIEVPEEVVRRYHGLSREESEALAVELSAEYARRMTPFTAGLYLVTPFRRIALMERLLKRLAP